MLSVFCLPALPAHVTDTTTPQALETPLPGGSVGATVRLHPLLAGQCLVPPGLLERPPGRLGRPRGMGFGVAKSDWTWIPIPAFLIEHPSAGPVLVDTGFHPSVAVDPKRNMGRISTLLYEFRVTAEQALHVQLQARGVDPQDVRVVIMTHLHWDHASGVSELPAATFVLDRREWPAARAHRSFMRGYTPRQLAGGLDWRAVDFDAPGVGSVGPFGHGVDLFGDGSVRLLSTPGHTRGHQSVLLRLGDREALLTGDAAYSRRTIEKTVMPLLSADERLFRRSLSEIQRFAAQSPDALVVPGHDPDTWRTLDAVYG